MTKTSDAINALTGPSPQLNDEQCIRIYDAVTRRNFTRDVKTDADKCATVRQAQLGCTATGPAAALPLPPSSYPQNRTMGSVRKVPQVIHYWNGMVFFGGRQRKAFVAAHSRADAARVLLECGIHNCSQRYIKEFFSECWGSSEQRELPQDVRGVWVQVDRHRYQRLEVVP